jgi:hypothetical protein
VKVAFSGYRPEYAGWPNSQDGGKGRTPDMDESELPFRIGSGNMRGTVMGGAVPLGPVPRPPGRSAES